MSMPECVEPQYAAAKATIEPDRAVSPTDEAIDAACRAEGNLGSIVAELAERLRPVLRLDEASLHGVPGEIRPPTSEIRGRILSHADAVESQNRRLRDLIESLDI